MSKEEIEKLLDHYGVLFTEAIADKLLEIITRERTDAINKFVTIFESNMVWEKAHFNDEKRIIYQMHILAEQLKEQNNGKTRLNG